jgi:nicotinamide-nucleotide amidase
MWEEHVLPALRPGRIVRTRAILTFGLGESEVAAKLGPLMERTHSPLVGTTASKGVIAVRIRYEGAPGRIDSAAVTEAEHVIAATESVVRERLGPVVFGVDHESLAGVVLEALKARGQKLTTVESCTGGLLGQLITDIPGSSAAFLGGWVTYSNQMKQQEVGVPAELFTPSSPGAVSREVAAAMARGGLERWGGGADWCLSITGIAGPEGGTPEKPVGTVWIGLAWRHDGRTTIDCAALCVCRRALQHQRLVGAGCAGDAPLPAGRPAGGQVAATGG